MMKKSSKVVSLLLAVLMALSCLTGLTVASVSAAEDTTINFKVPDSWIEQWGAPKAVYCHIYHIYGEGNERAETTWATSKEKCKYDATTGIATYDLQTKGLKPLAEGNDYAVLFMVMDQNDAQHQTGNVTLSTECYGGTVYVTGNMTENTEDSTKLDYEARWQEAELDAKYGPRLGITSTGKVINDYVPAHMPKALPIAQFIGNFAKSATNAQYVTPENVQSIMNDARFQVTAKEVMDIYASYYAKELAEGKESVATLDEVAVLVGYTEEPATEEPTTEEPTTVPTTQFGVPVYGDADLNGNITIDDATLVQKAGINLVTLTEEQQAVANVNPDEDDVINIIDVTYIQKWIAGGYTKTAQVGLPYTEAVDTYVVAGPENVFGVNWDGTAAANTMTEADGIYTLTLKDVQPTDHAQFKIVKNGTEWIGNGDFNYDFAVTEACDVTITFDPATGRATVEGNGVTEYVFTFGVIRAVGNGDLGWLNDVGWDPANDANLMTEVSDGVYQLVMTDVHGNDNAEIKFAADGDWAINWGGTFAGFDVETDAVYNAEGNFKLTIGEGEADTNLYTITVTLDLSAFDYNSPTKSGAKVTISQQVQADEPETTAEVEETTAEVEETTAEVEETTNPDDPTPSTDTYVVAGVEAVFGVDWDGTAVANMMLDQDGDGVYTFTLKNVQPITDAEFKIVKNGKDWIGPKDATGPFDNFKFTVEVVSDVTFSYNVAENEVAVSIVPVSTEETTAPVEETTAPVEETTTPAPEKVFDSVGLIGVVDGNGGWDKESYELEYADGVWSVVIEFTGGNNQFKARANDGWDISFGDGGDGEGSDYKETLTGTYKISVADGAANGTALTVEPIAIVG